MPIYEYKCTSCGKLIEVIQRMADAPLTTCESCSAPLEKILSRTSFQLSGGGWSSSGYSKGDAAPSKGDAAPSKPATTTEPGPSASPDTKKASGGGCGTGCGCH